jgi:subtilisin family serine protease
MVLCVATGNTPGHTIFYPARWPETIAVGATDNRDNLADFTTTGPEMSVGAPGVAVYSCVDSLLMGGFDTYAYSDGTSMACPHVAGLAALVWSANLSLTNDEVRAIIESAADDLGPAGWDQSFGHGRINAYAAVSAAMEPAIDGDVDNDGDVDISDLSALLAAYGTCSGDPDYNANADFDNSGCVDIVDLSTLLANYGYGT